MEKEIKDYLHLYLGCEAAIGYDPIKYPLAGMRIDTIVDVSLNGCYTSSVDFEKFEDVKPILRPLSDMTEEEKTIVDKISMKLQTVSWKLGCAEVTQYLLSKHFDLFSLIESELAIDKTKTIPDKV